MNTRLISKISLRVSIVLYFLGVCLTIFAQGFEFKMGVGLRITPIYSNPIGVGAAKILIDDQRHLTGSNLNLDLGYYFDKVQLSTSIVSSFRYDLVAFEKPDGRFSPSKKDFISDYTIRIDKYIRSGKNSFMIIGIGLGFMNNGTEFGLQSQAGVVNGSPVYIIQLVDLAYKSLMFSAGYQLMPWSVRINAITSRGNEFFNEKGSFVLPELTICRKIF